jgi:ureidoglycolate dehydrogenase (NAD+)
MPLIDASALREFSARLLQAGGFSEGDAIQTSDMLVWADLRGIASHGVLRIPRYIEMISLGITVSGGDIRTVQGFGAVAVLDGGKCPGAVGMNAAVGRAAELAAGFGVGWCAARSISHAGALGYFATQLAQRGLIGMVMSASKPLMAYVGAKGEAVSTNPIAIGVPVPARDPVVLDMSTAAVSNGKIVASRDAGVPLGKGWAIDKDGRETTDPDKVAALLPMAGAKGAGLSLMIEVLTSVLAGNAVIGPVLLGRKKGGFNGLVIAINAEAFGPRQQFDDGVGDLVRAIHGLSPAEGIEAVLLPGERSNSLGRQRSQDGIPLSAGTARRLVEAAVQLGVAVPAGLASAS